MNREALKAAVDAVLRHRVTAYSVCTAEEVESAGYCKRRTVPDIMRSEGGLDVEEALTRECEASVKFHLVVEKEVTIILVVSGLVSVVVVIPGTELFLSEALPLSLKQDVEREMRGFCRRWDVRVDDATRVGSGYGEDALIPGVFLDVVDRLMSGAPEHLTAEIISRIGDDALSQFAVQVTDGYNACVHVRILGKKPNPL